MRLVVASGKGGTGKTTVATSLALSLAATAPAGTPPPLFLDCDVEAPDADIFLRPAWERREEAGVPVPVVNLDLCTRCGACSDACQFHAILLLGQTVLVMPQLCHGCGSCTNVCPAGAIREEMRPLGMLEAGTAAGGIAFARGILNIGEAIAVPLIRQLKRWSPAAAGQPAILDAPPGTTCPVVETARGADFLLLVTEPTPFGLHDLRLAVAVGRELGLPAGVIINRDGIGDAAVDDYCREAGVPVLMRIPFSRAIAEGIASGRTLAELDGAWVPRFRQVWADASALAGEGRGS